MGAAIFEIGHDFASLSFSRRFQIASDTGITPRREIRTSSQSANTGSFFMTASDTGFLSRFTGLTSTATAFGSSSSGSGCGPLTASIETAWDASGYLFELLLFVVLLPPLLVPFLAPFFFAGIVSALRNVVGGAAIAARNH